MKFLFYCFYFSNINYNPKIIFEFIKVKSGKKRMTLEFLESREQTNMFCDKINEPSELQFQNIIREKNEEHSGNNKDNSDNKKMINLNHYNNDFITDFLANTADTQLDSMCALLQKLTSRVIYLRGDYVNSYSTIDEFLYNTDVNNRGVNGFELNVGNVEKGLNVYHGKIGSDVIYIFREDLSIILNKKSS